MDKTVKHVKTAGKVENIIFWTLQQLPLIDNLDMPYLVLDSFYSTGKTEVLKHYGKGQLENGLTIHYFNHRPLKMKGSKNLLPFTLMLQGEFPEGVVKETTFLFGVESVDDFLKENRIQSDHVLIFDEVICTKYTKQFMDALIEIKNSVASLWIAMGAEPLIGNLFNLFNFFSRT